MNIIKYFKDIIRIKDKHKKIDEKDFKLIDSKIDIFNDDTGERLFEPLHNKTVVAGSALTAMKLFALDRSILDRTPTYNEVLGLNNSTAKSKYPTISIKDNDGNIIGEMEDEMQRIICGFCLGQGGAGLDISDVFETKYCSWIEEDNLIPFRYPLDTNDAVDETMYKGKKSLTLSNNQKRNAYYFKLFSNTPKLEQNYLTNFGDFSDNINSTNVYADNYKSRSDMGRSYVELHLKITKDDAREFFIAHKGLENAKINQISLVSAWSTTETITKLDIDGNTKTKQYEYLQDIRPFSILNIPNEVLSDLEKSISIIYTLYF